MKKNKKHARKIRNFVLLIIDPILLVVTFALPFVCDHIKTVYPNIAANSIWLFQILSALFVLLISIGKSIYDTIQNKKSRKNERSRMILSHINLLFDHKAELIRDSTYRPHEQTNNTPLFYNVHGYIRDVCKNLKDIVAAIIETESEYVDVALIYKYTGSSDWKWLSGKSGTSAARSLNEFVQEPTLFNYVIKEKQIVFENDKSACKFYLPKRRDHFFNNKGSVMAMPLTYFNNQDALIEFVLVISTYGVRFVESNKKDLAKEFRETLVYEILPYYISHLQTAFGEMYLRHVYKSTPNNKNQGTM